MPLACTLTLRPPPLLLLCCHNNHRSRPLLPHHPPEVSNCVGEGGLGHYETTPSIPRNTNIAAGGTCTCIHCCICSTSGTYAYIHSHSTDSKFCNVIVAYYIVEMVRINKSYNVSGYFAGHLCSSHPWLTPSTMSYNQHTCSSLAAAAVPQAGTS